MELEGIVACPGIATGKVYIAKDWCQDSRDMNEGQVLVMKFSTPAFYEFFLKASAIVTQTGGITCHAASLSRDLNLPCVVSVENILELVKNGDIITVDAQNGVIYV